MRLIIFRHGQDRDHGDTTVLSSLTSGSLVHSRKVSVHISRISAAARNLFLSGGDLTKSVRIVCNISQDNQYVHILLKCKIFCCRQRHTRSRDTLYSRVIRQVDEQDCSVNGSRLLKGLDKVVGLLEGNTHSSEYNGEILVRSANLRLSCDLSRQL